MVEKKIHVETQNNLTNAELVLNVLDMLHISSTEQTTPLSQARSIQTAINVIFSTLPPELSKSSQEIVRELATNIHETFVVCRRLAHQSLQREYKSNTSRNSVPINKHKYITEYISQNYSEMLLLKLQSSHFFERAVVQLPNTAQLLSISKGIKNLSDQNSFMPTLSSPNLSSLLEKSVSHEMKKPLTPWQRLVLTVMLVSLLSLLSNSTAEAQSSDPGTIVREVLSNLETAPTPEFIAAYEAGLNHQADFDIVQTDGSSKPFFVTVRNLVENIPFGINDDVDSVFLQQINLTARQVLELSNGYVIGFWNQNEHLTMEEAFRQSQLMVLLNSYEAFALFCPSMPAACVNYDIPGTENDNVQAFRSDNISPTHVMHERMHLDFYLREPEGNFPWQLDPSQGSISTISNGNNQLVIVAASPDKQHLAAFDFSSGLEVIAELFSQPADMVTGENIDEFYNSVWSGFRPELQQEHTALLQEIINDRDLTSRLSQAARQNWEAVVPLVGEAILRVAPDYLPSRLNSSTTADFYGGYILDQAGLSATLAGFDENLQAGLLYLSELAAMVQATQEEFHSYELEGVPQAKVNPDGSLGYDYVYENYFAAENAIQTQINFHHESIREAQENYTYGQVSAEIGAERAMSLFTEFQSTGTIVAPDLSEFQQVALLNEQIAINYLFIGFLTEGQQLSVERALKQLNISSDIQVPTGLGYTLEYRTHEFRFRNDYYYNQTSQVGVNPNQEDWLKNAVAGTIANMIRPLDLERRNGEQFTNTANEYFAPFEFLLKDLTNREAWMTGFLQFPGNDGTTPGELSIANVSFFPDFQAQIALASLFVTSDITMPLLRFSPNSESLVSQMKLNPPLALSSLFSMSRSHLNYVTFYQLGRFLPEASAEDASQLRERYGSTPVGMSDEQWTLQLQGYHTWQQTLAGMRAEPDHFAYHEFGLVESKIQTVSSATTIAVLENYRAFKTDLLTNPGLELLPYLGFYLVVDQN